MSRQSCIQSLSESLFIVSAPQRKKCILLRPLQNKEVEGRGVLRKKGASERGGSKE